MVAALVDEAERIMAEGIEARLAAADANAAADRRRRRATSCCRSRASTPTTRPRRILEDPRDRASEHEPPRHAVGSRRAAPYRSTVRDETAGTPVGRRVSSGSSALGAAGVRVRREGRRTASATARADRSKDSTGLSSLLPFGTLPLLHGHRRLPEAATAGRTGSTVNGLVDKPVHALVRRAARRCRRRCSRRTSSASRAGGSPTRTGPACSCATLLDRAGVKPEGEALRFVSFDGTYTESLTLDQARRRRRARRLRARRQAAVAAITAARRGSTSRRCTATSRASGSSASRSPTDVDPRLLGGRRLRRRRLGRPEQRPRRQADVVTRHELHRPQLAALRSRRARRALVRPRRCSSSCCSPACRLYVGPLSDARRAPARS